MLIEELIWDTVASGLDPQKCYKLVTPGLGLLATEFFVPFNDALKECTLQGGFLIRNEDVYELVSEPSYDFE